MSKIFSKKKNNNSYAESYAENVSLNAKFSIEFQKRVQMAEYIIDMLDQIDKMSSYSGLKMASYYINLAKMEAEQFAKSTAKSTADLFEKLG